MKIVNDHPKDLEVAVLSGPVEVNFYRVRTRLDLSKLNVQKIAVLRIGELNEDSWNQRKKRSPEKFHEHDDGTEHLFQDVRNYINKENQGRYN